MVEWGRPRRGDGLFGDVGVGRVLEKVSTRNRRRGDDEAVEFRCCCRKAGLCRSIHVYFAVGFPEHRLSFFRQLHGRGGAQGRRSEERSSLDSRSSQLTETRDIEIRWHLAEHSSGRPHRYRPVMPSLSYNGEVLQQLCLRRERVRWQAYGCWI
jgi:hypothetical protein